MTDEDDHAEVMATTYQAHRAGLAGAVRSILGSGADVVEVLQESYLRALKAIRKGTQPKDPVSFAFVVTLNLARDLGRRKGRRPKDFPLEDTDAMTWTSTEPPPSGRAESSEAVAAARAAISHLRDAEREVFLLRVSGQLSFEAIGDSLGIPVGTAKTRMRLALQNLRSRLSAADPSTDLQTGRISP